MVFAMAVQGIPKVRLTAMPLIAVVEMRYLIARQHKDGGTGVRDDRTGWSSALLLLLIFGLILRLERICMIHLCLRHIE